MQIRSLRNLFYICEASRFDEPEPIANESIYPLTVKMCNICIRIDNIVTTMIAKFPMNTYHVGDGVTSILSFSTSASLPADVIKQLMIPMRIRTTVGGWTGVRILSNLPKSIYTAVRARGVFYAPSTQALYDSYMQDPTFNRLLSNVHSWLDILDGYMRTLYRLRTTKKADRAKSLTNTISNIVVSPITVTPATSPEEFVGGDISNPIHLEITRLLLIAGGVWYRDANVVPNIIVQSRKYEVGPVTSGFTAKLWLRGARKNNIASLHAKLVELGVRDLPTTSYASMVVDGTKSYCAAVITNSDSTIVIENSAKYMYFKSTTTKNKTKWNKVRIHHFVSGVCGKQEDIEKALKSM